MSHAMVHDVSTIWVAVAAIVLLLLALWWRAATATRRGNMRRGRIARRAEQAAERLLARRGYTVVDRQVTGGFPLRIDGVDVDVTCRADLIVRRRRRHWVAEVKTGGVADATVPATRRQLLEYRLAFDVDGVLLVDMVEGVIHEVAFPLLEGSTTRRRRA